MVVTFGTIVRMHHSHTARFVKHALIGLLTAMGACSETSGGAGSDDGANALGTTQDVSADSASADSSHSADMAISGPDTAVSGTDAGNSSGDASPPCNVDSDCPPSANPCTGNFCDATFGCIEKLKPDGAICDDGDACTAPDYCEKGACTAGKPVLCDDKNPCTKDQCDAKSGQCTNAPLDGIGCDDGDPLTLDDTCAASVCKGVLKGCKSDAECVSKDPTLCDGAAYCDKSSAPFTCKENSAAAVTCTKEEDTACAKNSCDPKTGTCAMSPTADGTPCDDGQECTAGDVCAAGSCTAGKANICCTADADCEKVDDGDKCNGVYFCHQATKKCTFNPTTVVHCPTVDDTACRWTACAPKTGQCVKVSAADSLKKPCNADSNPCTPHDFCKAGSCVVDPNNVCQCEGDADCAKHEDGNLCNGTLFCDKLGGGPGGKPSCALNAATKTSCATVDDTACAGNRCVKKTGKCTFAPLPGAATCDYDGNPCTAKDHCTDGICQGVPEVTCECQADKDCVAHEDGDSCNGTLYCDVKSKKCRLNPATIVRCPFGQDTECQRNRCGKKTGKCGIVVLPDGRSCDADGNPCTVNDTCQKGDCAAADNSCPCQKDADCAKAEDGDPCNGTLVCDGKSNHCVVNPATVVHCPGWEDNACRANRCQPATGKCALTPIRNLRFCNADDNPCTPYDSCKDGKCLAGANVCACGLDGDCDKFNDKDLCTAQLYCPKPGQPPWFCAPNPAKVVDCPDGVGCATQRCEPTSGECNPASAGDGAPCDDNNACTKDDSCLVGKCSGVPAKQCPDGDVCTAWTCDEKTGLCASKSKLCDDNNLCTNDACSLAAEATKTGGCVHVANTAECDDGDKCTVVDACKNDVCSGKSKDCDDGEACTTDGCDPKTAGCLHAANTGPCDDGDKCSLGDVCKDGACTAGAQKVQCDDGNACTTDACAKATGKCGNQPVIDGGACDDGSACVVNELCAKAVCKGNIKDCGDGNECTADSCDKLKGCVNAALQEGASCGDAKSCAGPGTCKANKCQGKQPRLWNMELGSGPFSRLDDITWLASGRILAVGSNGQAEGSQPQHWVVVMDERGKTLAEVKGQQQANQHFERFWLVEPLGADKALVSGEHHFGSTPYGLVVQLDKDGKEAWRAQDGKTSVYRDMAVVSGEAVVAGFEQVGKYGQVLLTRLDSKGKPAWRTLDPAPKLTAHVVAARADGSLLVMGDYTDYRYWMAEYSKAGVLQWRRTYRPGNGIIMHKLLALSDGGAVLIGRANVPAGSTAWRFNADGGVAWWRVIDTMKHGDAYDGVLVGDRVVVNTFGRDAIGHGGPGMARLDLHGNIRWMRNEALTASQPTRIAPMPDGSWLMVGYRAYYPTNLQARAYIKRVDAWGHDGCTAAGTCAAMDHKACAVAGICEQHGCDPSKACVKTAITAPCNDGDACTWEGTCQFATCKDAAPKLGPFAVAGETGETGGIVAHPLGPIVTASTVTSAGVNAVGMLRKWEAGKVVQSTKLAVANEDTQLVGLTMGASLQYATFGQRGKDAFFYLGNGVFGQQVSLRNASKDGTIQRFVAGAQVSYHVWVSAGVNELGGGKSKGLLARNNAHTSWWWTKTFGEGTDARGFVGALQRGSAHIGVGYAGPAGAGKSSQIWLVGVTEYKGDAVLNEVLTTTPSSVRPYASLVTRDGTLVVGGAATDASGKAFLTRIDANNKVLATTLVQPTGGGGGARIEALTELWPSGLASLAAAGTGQSERHVMAHTSDGKIAWSELVQAGKSGVQRFNGAIAMAGDYSLIAGGADVVTATKVATPVLQRLGAQGESGCAKGGGQ